MNIKLLAKIAVSVSLVIAFVVLLFSRCSSSESPIMIELPEIGFTDKVEYTSGSGGSDNVLFDVSTGFMFKANQADQTVNIHNNESNDCIMIARLFLTDGTELYSSVELAPGDHIDNISLSTCLSSGVYKSILVYECYSTDGEPITQCEFPIEISCS